MSSTPKSAQRVVRYTPNLARNAAAASAAIAAGTTEAANTAPVDEPPADWMALASLVLGVIGLMFRYKLCAWLAVFACLGSIANMRKRDFDYKQVATSLLFSVMSLMMQYLGAARTPGPNASTMEKAAAGGLSAFW